MAESLLLLSGRRATTTPVLAPGEVRELTLDEKGQLRVVTDPESVPEPVVFPIIDKTLTTSERFAFDVTDANTVAMQLHNDGTPALSASGMFTFESSIDSTDGEDGSWVPFYMTRSNNTADINTTAGISPPSAFSPSNVVYRGSVAAFTMVRIRTVSAVPAGPIPRWRIVRSLDQAALPTYVPAPPTSVTIGSGTITSLTRLAALPLGTSFSYVTTAGTNIGSLISASGVNLYELTLSNPTATAAYLKLYAMNTNPTLASSVPDMIIPIPANSFQCFNFGPAGKRFTSGISRAVTGGIAATDATNSVAGILISATTG